MTVAAEVPDNFCLQGALTNSPVFPSPDYSAVDSFIIQGFFFVPSPYPDPGSLLMTFGSDNAPQCFNFASAAGRLVAVNVSGASTVSRFWVTAEGWRLHLPLFFFSASARASLTTA
jgi:hypothetical protein